MHTYGAGKLRIPLLAATALLAAIWVSVTFLHPTRSLPRGWEAATPDVRDRVGGIELPPRQILSFHDLEPFSQGAFEIEVHLRISEYDRFALGLGADDACDRIRAVFPIEGETAISLPRRINLESNDQGLMAYEDGKPVRKYLETGTGASCFSIHSISSTLTVQEVRILREDTILYRETFRPTPDFDSKFWMALIAALCLVAGAAILEKRIAIGSWRLPFEQVSLSQWIAILPFLVFSFFSLFWEWAAKLVAPSLAWLLFSRLAFAYRHAPLFAGGNDQARTVRRILLILVGLWLMGFGFFSVWERFVVLRFPPHILVPFILGQILLWFLLIVSENRSRLRSLSVPAAAAAAVSSVFFYLGLFLPEYGMRVTWAIGLVNFPFAAVCLFYRYADSIRSFTLLALVALAFFAGSMEIALRFFPETRPAEMGDMEKHDHLFWVPAGFFSDDTSLPAQAYTVEKIAFRSGPTTVQKPANVFRILVMGGSNVWGDGLQDGRKAFPTVMERLLNESQNRRVEVINGGVAGYGSLQVLVLLKYYLAGYHPDLAVFYLLWNDTNQRYGTHTLRELYEMATRSQYRAAQWAQRHLRRSALYNGLVDVVASLRRELDRDAGDKLELKKTKSDLDFRKNLEEILQVCRKWHIQPVFVVEYQGADHALGYPYNVGNLERILKAVAVDQGVPILDANAWFYNQGDWREMMIQDDIMHLSEKGHEELGEYISNFLVNQNLIP